MERGRERFGIYCAPCHGFAGEGDGMVAKRAARSRALGCQGSWVAADEPHAETSVRCSRSGSSSTPSRNGIRNMPGYGAQITPKIAGRSSSTSARCSAAARLSSADVDPAERASLK